MGTGATRTAPGGGGRRLFAPLLIAAVAGISMTAAPASADFHFIKIREVYPGGAANSSYVVLQMYAGGQTNLAPDHHIDVYDASGGLITTFPFASDVANGQNQATVLVADSAYATAFPGPTYPTPDATHAALDIPAAGGAVCFDAPDCVSWGSFSGSLPSAAGTPAPGPVTAGKALHRSIAAGCATLLEVGDDTDSSAADFSEQNPNPRSNASTILEGPCPSVPNTTILTRPTNPSNDTSPSFTYQASPSAGASFECKLDAGAFESCSASGITYDGPLSETTHTFEVRAKNSAGTDPSPATYTWKITTASPPETTIESAPPDPSTSSTASFTYASSETGSTFECKLDGAAFAPCPASGVTYTGLANGSHGFQVRAIKNGLTDPTPDGYSWEVAAPEVEPPTPPPPSFPSFVLTLPPPVPQTTLTGKPTARTADRTPSFRFRSSVAESSFACKVDRGRFRPCVSPFTTKQLSLGAHTVQVRAAASGVVDPSPARSAFRVVKAPEKGRR